MTNQPPIKMTEEMIEAINNAEEVYRNTLDKNQDKFNTVISEYSYDTTKKQDLLTEAEDKLTDCMIAYETALEAFDAECYNSFKHGVTMSVEIILNYNKSLTDRNNARKHWDEVYNKYLQLKQADYDTLYDIQLYVLNCKNDVALKVYNDTIKQIETDMNDNHIEKDVVKDNTRYTIEMYASALVHAVLAENNAVVARHAAETGHAALVAAADAGGFAYLNTEETNPYREKCRVAIKEALKADKDADDALTKYIAKMQQ